MFSFILALSNVRWISVLSVNLLVIGDVCLLCPPMVCYWSVLDFKHLSASLVWKDV